MGIAQIYRIHPFDGDVNSLDHGDPVEVENDGIIDVTFPNPVPKAMIWNTATKERMYVSAGDDVPPGYTDIEPPHPVYSVWEGVDWGVNLEAAKADKMLAIRMGAQSFLDAVAKNEYPQWEVETWKDQETEAVAWDADNTTPTPFIDIIANNRGMDRLELIQRILENVANWKPLALAVVGQRLKLKDDLDVAVAMVDVDDATRLAAIENIEVEYAIST